MGRRKSTFSKVVSASIKYNKQVAREAEKQRRDLQKQMQEQAKLDEKRRAALEVRVYENQLKVLTSIHHEEGEPIDWNEILDLPEPEKPVKDETLSKQIEQKLETYTPSFFDKILFQTKSKIKRLQNQLKEALEQENETYTKEMEDYESEKKTWSILTGAAQKISNSDSSGFLEALDFLNPFSDISNLGSSLSLKVFPSMDVIEVNLNANSDEVLPKQVKTLTKTGKVSTKNMPKTQYNELYQDYICGCLLRVGRELFPRLPVQLIIANANTPMLNSQTGHMEDECIVSAGLMRETFEQLNFERLDPSDSFSNFKHNMKFKKSNGFAPVQTLAESDFKVA